MRLMHIPLASNHSVMPGLVPGIHVLPIGKKDVDGRGKPGHGEDWIKSSGIRSSAVDGLGLPDHFIGHLSW